jgi:hypothetical protein
VSNFIQQHEKKHKSLREINYLLFKSDSPYLLVSFSAYNPNEVSYTYTQLFDHLPCNRLHILDNFGYEKKGAWYLCENLDFSVEYSVVELIKHIQSNLCVQNNNVITVGYSKGGWSAIYFALKYNYQHVVAGGVPVLLGDYLNDQPAHRNILNGIIGPAEDKKISFLNNLLVNQIVPSEKLQLFLHYGLGDYHLSAFIKHFYESARINIPNLYLDLQLYGGHSSMKNQFPLFLRDTVKTIVIGHSDRLMGCRTDFEVLQDALLKDLCRDIKLLKGDSGKIIVEFPVILDNAQYAVYIIGKNNIPIAKQFYQKTKTFEFNGVDIDEVSALQLFFKNSIGIKSIIKMVDKL